MSCVSVSTEVVYTRRRSGEQAGGGGYKIDLCREARRRRLVAGVLCAAGAAAVWPRGGAPGGPLRAEYCVYLPLWYTYFAAGRSWRAGRLEAAPAPTGECSTGPSSLVLALGCLHAHAVAPVLSALAVEAFKGAGLNYRLVNGVILSSVGGPCPWLSLAWGARPEAGAGVTHLAPLLAASYVTSLLAAPLLMIILCGRATVPPLGGVLSAALTALAPFSLGALLPLPLPPPAPPPPPACTPGREVCALLVLYCECCARLRAAEGALYVQDVLATLLLVVGYVLSSACVCWLYHRCGLVSRGDARLLAVAAVPKCLDVGWESSTMCTPAGLSLLPAAFLAPAQALLLAALATHDDAAGDARNSGPSVYQSLPQ